MDKLRKLQNNREKRKSNNAAVDPENEAEVCSPKKQRKVEQEAVQKSKFNALDDSSSGNEESDSDSDAEMVVEKGKAFEVDSNDESGNSDSDASEEEDDDDDDDDSHEIDMNKITDSSYMKLNKDNKLTQPSKSLQSGNTRIESQVSSSGNEDSDDSSENDSSDNEDTVRLKSAPVDKKQQPVTNVTFGIGNNKQLKRTVKTNSDNDERCDSSDDDDDDDDEVKNIENKEETDSKGKVSSLNKPQKDEEGSSSSSDSDNDDESDDDDTDNEDKLGSSKSESQISDKHKVGSTVKQGVKMKVKESSDSDINDSSDDDDDDEEDEETPKIRYENTDTKGTSSSWNGPENDESEDEFAAVKKELADIPLEDLMKIKEKLGLKMFNRIMHGDKFEEKKQKVFKRENKNRPMEITAKKRVPVLRQAIVAKEKVRRDPRFDDLSGEFQDKHFMKNYSFLDDIKSKEKLLVQKKMKKTKDEDKKKELGKLLNRMNQQEQTEQQKKHRIEMEQQWKEKEKQLVKDGKTPYFLKKSEKKKLELAEKYKELQKSGKVDQYMSKRLKKNAQKEKKKLPGRHQKFM